MDSPCMQRRASRSTPLVLQSPFRMRSLTPLSPLFPDMEPPSHLTDDLPPIFDQRPPAPLHYSPFNQVSATIKDHGRAKSNRSRASHPSQPSQRIKQVRAKISPKLPFKGEFNVKGLNVDSDGGRDKFIHESKNDFEELKAPSSRHTSRVPSVDHGVSDLTAEMMKHFPDCDIEKNGVYFKNNKNRPAAKIEQPPKQSTKDFNEIPPPPATVESTDGEGLSAHERVNYLIKKAATKLAKEIAQEQGKEQLDEADTIGLGSVLSSLSMLMPQTQNDVKPDVNNNNDNNTRRSNASNASHIAKAPSRETSQATSISKVQNNLQATKHLSATNLSAPKAAIPKAVLPKGTIPSNSTSVPKHNNYRNTYIQDLTEQSLKDPDIFGPDIPSNQLEHPSDNQNQPIFDPVTRTFKFETDPSYVAAAKKDISARVPSWTFPDPKTFQGPDSGFMAHDQNEEKAFLENQVQLYQQIAEEELAANMQQVDEFQRYQSRMIAAFNQQQAKAAGASENEIARLKAELNGAKTEQARASKASKAEIARLKAELAAAKTEQAKASRASKTEIVRLKTELDTTKTELHAAKTEAQEDRTAFNRRQAKASKASKAEMARLKSELDVAKGELDVAKTDIHKRKEERKELVAALFYEWGKAEVGEIERVVNGVKVRGMGYRYKYVKRGQAAEAA